MDSNIAGIHAPTLDASITHSDHHLKFNEFSKAVTVTTDENPATTVNGTVFVNASQNPPNNGVVQGVVVDADNGRGLGIMKRNGFQSGVVVAQNNFNIYNTSLTDVTDEAGVWRSMFNFTKTGLLGIGRDTFPTHSIDILRGKIRVSGDQINTDPGFNGGVLNVVASPINANHGD